MLPPIPSTMLSEGPYGLPAADKTGQLSLLLDSLTRHHYERCTEYRNLVDALFGGLQSAPYGRMEDLPFFPVSLFKQFTLKSIPDAEVIKVLTSSGTTGQAVSRIHLDKETALLQSTALVRIMQSFLGKARLPMIVLDHPGVIKNRDSFSARGAGILGVMQFGRQPLYALDEDMRLNTEAIRAYLAKFSGTPVLFFGFTFMAWEFAIARLREQGIQLPPNNGILIHSGGWKKLEASRVDAGTFSSEAKRTLGVSRVVNFYGMVEQVGSVFFENPKGFLHAPVFADILIRDPLTLKPLGRGQPGLIQVLSVLPRSYPGHSLLTEDIGVLEGEDDPELGMRGKYFRVLGRAPRSEIRGCSDTYAR